MMADIILKGHKVAKGKVEGEALVSHEPISFMGAVDPETGMKIRTLTDLKPTAAKEYQEAMLGRVEYFANRGDTVFNNQVENIVVKGINALLNLKIKLDEALGEEMKEKVHDAIAKIALLGL